MSKQNDVDSHSKHLVNCYIRYLSTILNLYNIAKMIMCVLNTMLFRTKYLLFSEMEKIF